MGEAPNHPWATASRCFSLREEAISTLLLLLDHRAQTHLQRKLCLCPAHTIYRYRNGLRM